MTKPLGFIGLGRMGSPMALNLIRAEYKLAVYDLNPKAVEDLVKAGAAKKDSVAELAGNSDTVITMLPADKEIMAVYTGTEGLLENLKEGAVCIDMTSATGQAIKDVAAIASQKGIRIIDAPVSGDVPGAQSGALTIMVGGEKNLVDEYMPILKVMGSRIFYTGDVGSGKSVKMINQFLNAGNTYIASEALVLAKKMGLDLDILCSIVNESSGGSWIFKNTVPNSIIPEKFDAGFKLDLMKKDVSLSVQQAQRDNLSLPGLALIHQIYQAVSNQGNGDKTYSYVSKWVESLNKPEQK